MSATRKLHVRASVLQQAQATGIIDAFDPGDVTKLVAAELLSARRALDAVKTYIRDHNQRSDDPEFDALCAAFVAYAGKDPRE